MNMKQKSTDQKRTRRNRYINAIEPFRQKYDCTAAQVFDIVQGIERRNNELQNKLTTADSHLKRIHKQGMEVKMQTILKSFQS